MHETRKKSSFSEKNGGALDRIGRGGVGDGLRLGEGGETAVRM